MPTRRGAPLGAPTWIDLSSSDTDRAKDFYGTVFGWTFESAGPGYGGYVNAFKDGQPVAGLMFNDPQWNSARTAGPPTSTPPTSRPRVASRDRRRRASAASSRWRSRTRAGWPC